MEKRYERVIIEGVDAELRGYFTKEDRQVLVAGTATGDEVDVAITSVSQHHPLAYAEVVNVHQRGENFQQPSCRHAAPIRGRCGGCPAMHLAPSTRDQIQLRAANQALEPLGVDVTWHSAPEQREYRNRSNFVAHRRSQEVILGSYAPRSQHVAAMRDCLVVRPAIMDLHRRTEDILTALKAPVDGEEEALRWVSMRESDGDVVVELVVRDADAQWIVQAADDLFALENVVGVGVSVNDRETNAIRVARTNIIRGKGTLQERYGQIDLQIPPGAFAQLNVDVASRIYNRAAQWTSAGPSDAPVVWDLYCGIGALGLNAVAGHENTENARIWGVESAEEAVVAARQNAALAEISAEFDIADLVDPDVVQALQPPEALSTPDVILVNPPRRGLSQPVRDRLCDDWTAQTLIYMSCDPKTFLRDATALRKAGWTLDEVEAHDMLPMTAHVELLARFTR